MGEKFMEGQGISMQTTILQDNESSILLCTKGRGSLGKQNKAMDVRYFYVKDHVDRGEIRIAHCPTEKMVGDFFTKPLQGKKFLDFRNQVLGLGGSKFALKITTGPRRAGDSGGGGPNRPPTTAHVDGKTTLEGRSSARKAPQKKPFRG